MTTTGNIAHMIALAGHRRKGWYSRSLGLMLGTLLLTGCSALSTLMPERAVNGVVETLPEPQGVALLDEVTRGSYGSDERCIGASVYRLYGTELPFDQILAFYE